ncbi:MAG: hypothetical protein WBA22_12575 [Candidatus Methanofastidiosia archaeon]
MKKDKNEKELGETGLIRYNTEPNKERLAKGGLLGGWTISRAGA